MKKAILGIVVIGVIALTSCGKKEYTCTCTFTDSTPTAPLPSYSTETIITGKKKDATVVCETNSSIQGFYKTECSI